MSFIKTWFLIYTTILCTQVNVGEMSLFDQIANYNAVGQFLRDWGENDFWWKQKSSDRVASTNDSNNNQDWLINSNKVGLSYNPLVGDPVCFTGECQMNGFGLPLFQMQFTETAPGTCVKQLVPKDVAIDCLPSTEHISTTETISDLQGLKNSQSDGVTWGVGFNSDVGGNGPLSQLISIGFNYQNSKQTRLMIDNIYQKDSVVFYSFVKVSYVKLMLYEPLLNLSTAFRHVIENMPSENSTMTEKYIINYILNYFGTTYVSDILLGGIAQMTSIMSRSKLNPFEGKSQSAAVSAGLTFGKLFNFNYKTDDNASNERISNFSRDVDQTYSTTLGGGIFAMDTEKLSDWFVTVPSNPVIVHFTIGSIFDLLTDAPNRFPGDLNIAKKATLIMQALSNLLNKSTTFCENDCTSPAHGTCTPTQYFQFGECTCIPPFIGKDCSVVSTGSPPAPTSAPPAPASTSTAPAPANPPIAGR